MKPPTLTLTLLALTGTATSECTHAYLTNAAAQYVAAQRAGLTSIYTSPSITYTENDVPLNISSSILATPLKIDRATSYHDTTLCASFTELIVTDPTNPYVIATRTVHDQTNSSLTTIHSIVSKPGDWAFNATGYIRWENLEGPWDAIPPSKRDTRATIQAAGDAYFSHFNDTTIPVPWATSCARIEGGAYTDSHGWGNNTCDGDVPGGNVVRNRRYVIDEVYGVVSIFVGFPRLDGTAPERAVPDSHLFRVEGGRIRFVHTVSACFARGCGWVGDLPPNLGQGRRRRNLGVAAKAVA
ncbi:hypothetical protein B0T19DRAFT_455427 [Cercophora scortea]|uniref:DUF8021 domain-containing protein n=1 Tax=Cercophora scortea TaxID=314031 RepID=A0AAE0J617_9PEZI|nr:hypothetical protein B0T19DRAFT_455427 [Cercophora scortea]